MGKKNKGQGSTLALQVDQDGLVRYDAIAQHGRAPGSRVQSSFKGELLHYQFSQAIDLWMTRLGPFGQPY